MSQDPFTRLPNGTSNTAVPQASQGDLSNTRPHRLSRNNPHRNLPLPGEEPYIQIIQKQNKSRSSALGLTTMQHEAGQRKQEPFTTNNMIKIDMKESSQSSHELTEGSGESDDNAFSTRRQM